MRNSTMHRLRNTGAVPTRTKQGDVIPSLLSLFSGLKFQHFRHKKKRPEGRLRCNGKFDVVNHNNSIYVQNFKLIMNMFIIALYIVMNASKMDVHNYKVLNGVER